MMIRFAAMFPVDASWYSSGLRASKYSFSSLARRWRRGDAKLRRSAVVPSMRARDFLLFSIFEYTWA